jgi:sulfite reductase (ferredoxin)
VPEDNKVSKVEIIKQQGSHLRGTIAEALEDGTTNFTEDNWQLLKFHGIYQQDDRDYRAIARKEGKEKQYSMMIRARIPGGFLTPQAYLQFDRLADSYGNQTMRITTRQTFQLHGVLKQNVKATIQGIHDVLVTTLGGCGDQVRNTISCANPIDDVIHQQMRSDLLQVVDIFSAKTNAYHEIWLDGAKISPDEVQNEEPLYGDAYMPRKFKFGFTLEGDNCCDVYSNDVGIVAHPDKNGQFIEGYTLLVGGSMGRTATDKQTYPRLATPIAYVHRAELFETCKAIFTIQRDFGNRLNRRLARFKYLLDERGMEWFAEELTRRVGRSLLPPRKLAWQNADDHLGWHAHGDGKYFLGLYIENGRINDTPGMKLKTVLRKIISEYQPSVRLTTQQNILLCDLKLQDRAAIEQLLQIAGVTLSDKISPSRLNAMACPALPTCGLAVAESERVFPNIVKEFEELLAELGLSDEAISIRMTGCPNGCARPYIADIGFTGRTMGKYDLFLGGDFYGSRLNELYRELVPMTEFMQILGPILNAFKTERQATERFGDYCYRVGFDYLRKIEKSNFEPAVE